MVRLNKIIIPNVPTLKKEDKVEEAAKLLAQQSIGCVVIVEGKKPIGIVTELDFLRSFASKGVNMKNSVSRLMISPVTCLNSNTKLDEALKIIDTKKFRRYPVVENGELVGIVTKGAVVNTISDNLRLHRNIQNTVLVLFVLFEFFIFIFT